MSNAAAPYPTSSYGGPIPAEHLRMQLRGARKQQADMVTTALRGVLAEDESMKRHAMMLLSGSSFSRSQG